MADLPGTHEALGSIPSMAKRLFLTPRWSVPVSLPMATLYTTRIKLSLFLLNQPEKIIIKERYISGFNV